MSTFADSSALVKLYVDEDHHEAVRGWAPLVVSQLARVEVPAALWRGHRRGAFGASAAAALVAQFEADYHGARPRFGIVAPVALVLDDAARLSRVHGLRAYDAVQLASARAAAAADDRVRTFAAFDGQLRDAAVREGFVLLPRA
ncbi:type II toxin-antitoxin system VapC family toxin [Actinomycetospora sp. TBRC 11914]|uniref:type II toxin-antitoxin system VapC family toxin n=1 Tax=Actinomycetospora sp. TBRC 11914 TaxID=2729387 RepID=UPI00145C3F67|nr:type II toxin-antitoxin system VapC family toxin [Actinomycetospora sp. TBRC 11914]NMO89801.1 type II toxin-antitoxin system VapC family toxin [Actinomycetospora sp. TBRC 11914]